MNMNELKLGFVGLGAMGLAMAKRLNSAGYLLQAYDRSAEALNQAEVLGITVANTLAETGTGQGLVLISVSNADLMEQVITGAGGLLENMPPEGIIVDLGTTPYAQSRELASLARQHNKYFLDAPVSGSTPWAEKGHLAMMVGGDQQAFALARPVLERLSNKIHYLGESGKGQLAKLGHQLTFVATLTGLAEAIALAERHDIDAKTLLTVLNDCVAPGHVLDFMLPLAANNQFDHGQSTLKLGQKDIKAVLQSAENCGIKLALAEMLDTYLDQAMTRGFEKSDLFALIDMARQQIYQNTDPT